MGIYSAITIMFFYISLQRKDVSEGNPLGQTFRRYAIFNAFPQKMFFGILRSFIAVFGAHPKSNAGIIPVHH